MGKKHLNENGEIMAHTKMNASIKQMDNVFRLKSKRKPTGRLI